MAIEDGTPQLPEGELVGRLRSQGIRDPRVLAAFARVPRAAFVPEEVRGEADADRALEIGLGQTISQPFIVAAMSEALRLSGRERVLEVGTGSGYQTAILAELLEPQVVLRTVEVRPALLRAARETLRALGYADIEYREGDGAAGWPEAAPFDGILVAAAPARVPEALLAQLAAGGRLVIPVGSDLESQQLELWTRDAASGRLVQRVLMNVRFVPLVDPTPRPGRPLREPGSPG
ncbi:MAG: protein-L-isoaspartate(D-aspartate) O-methyltransferase [Myxococcales bacterium]